MAKNIRVRTGLAHPDTYYSIISKLTERNNFQLSIFNFPFSTFHCQLSIVNCPLSIVHYQNFPIARQSAIQQYFKDVQTIGQVVALKIEHRGAVDHTAY
jgi:hypothetical protein